MVQTALNQGESFSHYSIDKIPSWVDMRLVSKRDMTSEYDSPLFYLLLDYQDKVSNNQFEYFCRTLVQINDESHIEGQSISLYDLAPENETITLHTCTIHRNGKEYDRLLPDSLRMLQRESNLENHVSSDTITVEMIIDDLRVGDVLEIASTRSEFAGSHSMYGKYFHSGTRRLWGVPIRQLNTRLVNAGDKAIQIQHLKGTETIERIAVQSGDSYEDKLENLKVDQTPNYVHSGYWSDYLVATTSNSWQSISAELYAEYEKQNVLSEVIDNEHLEDIDGIDWQDKGMENVTKLVRFVQDNIRYRSESNGIHTHTPKSINETLRRRVGDCKDKSALLVALLNHLDVDAEMVLVNSSLNHKLNKLNPSPRWFNHMVARIKLDGNEYVVDPTVQKQGGTLDKQARLQFEFCLPLSKAGSALSPVPCAHNPVLYERFDYIDLQHGTLSGCTLSVTRVFYQERADHIRAYLSSNEKSECAKALLDQNEELFSFGLDIVEGVCITEDDKVNNVVTTREEYQLKGNIADFKDRTFSYQSAKHEDFLMPESDEFPVFTSVTGTKRHTVSVVYANSPGNYNDKFEEKNEFFAYKDSIETDGNKITSTVEFQGLAEQVEVQEIATCRDAVKKLQERSKTMLPLKLNFEVKTSWKDHVWYLAPLLCMLAGLVLINN